MDIYALLAIEITHRDSTSSQSKDYNDCVAITIQSEMYIKWAIDIESLRLNYRIHEISCHKIIVIEKEHR